MTPLETMMLLIGVAAVVDRLMRLIEYLDGGIRHGTERQSQRRGTRRAAER